jgi:branched-chain amino acid transport system permease protein
LTIFGFGSNVLTRLETPALLVGLVAIPVALSAMAPGVLPPRMVAQGLIWLVMVVGLYVFTGLSGVVSFGQNAFSLLGAYCTAWLTLNPFVKGSSMPGLWPLLLETSLPPAMSAPLSVLFAAAIGAVLGLALARISGEAATIATFSFLIVIDSVFSNWSSVTGGASSIVGIPLVVGLGASFAVAAVSILIAYAFQTSSVGVMLQASRDDAVAARASGVKVALCRFWAFGLSSALMALGGILQAHFLGVVSVDMFYLGATFMTLAMLIVGGRGSLTGAVVGTMLVSALTLSLRALERGAAIGALSIRLPSGTQEVLVGALMLAVLIGRRRGLCGLWEMKLPRRTTG